MKGEGIILPHSGSPFIDTGVWH